MWKLYIQCWEFAHLFSERITGCLPKSERMNDLLKKVSNLLICPFLVSDLSDLLTIAHFWWATWANRSRSLSFGERPEWFAHSRSFVLSDLSKLLTVPHLIWAIWAKERWANEQIPSPGELLVFLSESLIRSFFLQKNEQFAQKTESNFSNFVIKYLGKIEIL